MGVVDPAPWGGQPVATSGRLPARGLVLVSGPSRSGKSRWAEHLALSSGLGVSYLATGAQRPGDGSWQERLRLHRQRRPANWPTLEVGGELEAALEGLAAGVGFAGPGDRAQERGAPWIQSHNNNQAGGQGEAEGQRTWQAMPNGDQKTPAPAGLLLIDSLGTWLAHHLDLNDGDWQHRQARLFAGLEAQPGPVVLVCEEVGWGVVPATAIGGLFRDRCGSLQQRLMEQAAAAWLVVQGRALNLMALGEAVPPG